MLSFHPPAYADYELAVMRLMFGYILYIYGLPRTIRIEKQTHPIGVARFIDLSFLAKPDLYRRLRFLAAVAIILYVVNIVPVWPLLYLALLFVVVRTFLESQGAVNHESHFVALVLVAQVIAFSLRPTLRYFELSNLPPTHSDEQAAVYWSQQAMMSAYFVSGVAKLADTGFLWVRDAANFPLTMVARSEGRYHDRLRDTVSRRRIRGWANWLIRWPLLCSVFFGCGLFLELLAPLALMNRVSLSLGGAAFLVLHQLNNAFLRIPFRRCQFLLLIYFINLPYIIVEVTRYCLP